MSKQDLIDFVEKVQNDPKWKDEADMVLLKCRFALTDERQIQELMIWHMMDELRNILLDTDFEGGYLPTRLDAIEIIRIVKAYLD